MACESAAEGGHLEVLQWLHVNDCPWDEDVCTEAARGGHLEMLKWARSENCPWDVDKCLEAAHDHFNNDIIEWIESVG